jgi:predicted GIY-YIG superfamily endonuclease
VKPGDLQSGGAVDNTRIYYGVDGNGDRVYTGITVDVPRRQGQHGDRFAGGLASLKDANGVEYAVTRAEARAIEQALINRVRLPNTPLSPPQTSYGNLRNSISPNHDYYDEAVQ